MSAPESAAADARARRRVLLAAVLGWMFDGLEMGLFPLVARPALQQMAAAGVADDRMIGHWMGWITALFLLGAAAGGLLFGWLGDRLGRIRAMTLAVLCYSVFTGLSYFAQAPWHLGAARLAAALGMGGEWALGVALVMEAWPEARRPWLAGVIGAAGNAGFALIAVVGLFYSVTPATWRVVVLVGALPALGTFLLRLCVPESARWRQAVAVRPVRPLRELLAPPAGRRALLVGTLLSSVVLIGTWGSVQWLPLWADQMAGPGRPAAKAYAQLAVALGSVAGSVLGATLGGRLGRRPSFCALSLASLAVCAALFRGIGAYGAPFLALAFAAGAATASFYGWLPLYLPELFPTRVRAVGQGIAYNAGRVLAAAGALSTGALMQAFDGSYARAGAVVSLVYAVGAAAVWLGPETRGRPLPD